MDGSAAVQTDPLAFHGRTDCLLLLQEEGLEVQMNDRLQAPPKICMWQISHSAWQERNGLRALSAYIILIIM